MSINKQVVAVTLALFLMLATIVAIWVGYEKLSDQLASVKSEVAARKDFIPPLFGQRHVALRQRFVLDQISQADGGFALVIGDSIVEGMLIPTIFGVPVVNAGIGGAGVTDVREFLAEVKHEAAVSGILICIGVNDAVYGTTTENYFNKINGGTLCQKRSAAQRFWRLTGSQ